MTAMKDAAEEFLGHKRVAVTGVSSTPGKHGSNVIYTRLRDRGYDVCAVNDGGDKPMRFRFTLSGHVPREV